LKKGHTLQGKIETRVGIFVLAAIGVFIYMGFKIGAFRFDRGKYNQYIMYFKDISGLSRKADVKIAGVKVGWVEKITLITNHNFKAEAQVMVFKNYTLYSNAYALIRQDGLLGPKYIEIIPGDQLLQPIKSGSILKEPSTEPVSVDQLMLQFKKIASNVEKVTESFKEVVGGVEGTNQLKVFFDNLQTTAEKFSSVSEILERSIVRNEGNLDAFLQIGTNINQLTTKLDSNIFPSFQESIEKISQVFDRDFNRIATRMELTTETLEDASIQAREGLRNLSSVAEKIDEGKGLLGKLVNEDETYRDLKIAVQGFKNYLTKVDRLQIVFDSHFESMLRTAENYEYEDSKGYLNVRIHPNQDHFYLVQLVNSEKGFIDRKETEKQYIQTDPVTNYVVADTDPIPESNIANFLIDTAKLDINDNSRLRNVFRKKKTTFNRNTLKIGIQFGKVFKDIALRLGLFDGTAGIGFDIDIPLKTENFRWVTTFEAFDLSGWNRKKDRRPHLKWLNRMFIFRNIYFAFGADDFVSKRNANAFFGAGVRFGDDDIKYLLGSVAGIAPGFVE
jgi:phospholipid/cholesterol/gamma-HCH transport system substrate-binding protein